MNEPNPCLIYDDRRGTFFVWNEDGRLVYTATYTPGDPKDRDTLFNDVTTMAGCLGYEPISPNSRLAATIRDKFRQKGYRV